jgi:hypothetical protein
MKAVRAWLLPGALLLGLLPAVAWGHNCGSLSDCFGTARAAIAAAVGVGLFGVLVSFGLDLIPGVGTVKGIIQAITGRDLITNQELLWWERLLGVVPYGRVAEGALKGAVEVLGDAVTVFGKEGGGVAMVFVGSNKFPDPWRPPFPWHPPFKQPPTPKPPPQSLDELYEQLSEKARKAFDQQTQLRSEKNLQEMENAYKNKADGTYDVARANEFFEKQFLSKEDSPAEFKLLEEGFQKKVKARIRTMQNTINDTNGTSRPGASLGKGTSEEALDQEILDGMPWKSANGHHVKVEGYTETLKSGVETLKGFREHLTDPKALSEVDAMIEAATQRIESMRPALERWNQRAQTHPDVWNPDGTSKNRPGWP